LQSNTSQKVLTIYGNRYKKEPQKRPSYQFCRDAQWLADFDKRLDEYLQRSVKMMEGNDE